MENLAEQVKAIRNGESYYSPRFNENIIFQEISINWLKKFKETLETPENRKKWEKVDTFIVIPVDAKNEANLFNTLEQYSVKQHLELEEKERCGFVLFLNTKDGVDIAKKQVERFQKLYPEINLTFHCHKFSPQQIRVLDVAKIRNVGCIFVSLLSNYFQKNSSEIVLIGADADAVRVSSNYLSSHIHMSRLKNEQDQTITTSTTSKLRWALTGDFYYDFYLINDQINFHEFAKRNSGKGNFPTTSFTLEIYHQMLGLATNAEGVAENYKLNELHSLSYLQRVYDDNSSVITDSRRAIQFLQNGGNPMNLSLMWSGKYGNWGKTGDSVRRHRNREVPNLSNHTEQIKEIILQIYKSHFLEVFETSLMADFNYENTSKKIIHSLNEDKSSESDQFIVVGFNLLHQNILDAMTKALEQSIDTLKHFTTISRESDLYPQFNNLIKSKDVISIVKNIFVGLMNLALEPKPLTTVKGNKPQSKVEKADTHLIKPEIQMHEVIKQYMKAFGVVVTDLDYSNRSDELFDEICKLGNVLFDYIDFDKFVETIESYQAKQCFNQQA